MPLYSVQKYPNIQKYGVFLLFVSMGKTGKHLAAFENKKFTIKRTRSSNTKEVLKGQKPTS